MSELTCIVIGGGYAGIHAVKAIRESLKKKLNVQRFRLILIDKQPYHLKKVLLFKSAAGSANITIPMANMFTEDITFIQGTVTTIESREKQLRYQDAEGNEHFLNYDILVVAVGSVVRKPTPEQGGIALTDCDAAARIREQWQENLRKAVAETNTEERKRLLTVAVAGAGISGIETSAELAYVMRKEAAALGLDPSEIRIYLVNAQERLFQEGPAKVGRKLERVLNSFGVTVLHRCNALHEKDGLLTLIGSEPIPVGLSIWTLGLMPNPALRGFGLPLTHDGQVIVDASYRVKDAPGVYSIGDCARIVDPETGRADRMTCKEAIAQASRLGKIIAADLCGRPAPTHKAFLELFCFGLGPEKGMVWIRQWGLDFILTGKLGWKIRKFTWDTASLVK